MNDNKLNYMDKLEIAVGLKRLFREYPVTKERLTILFDYTKDIFKCEDYCILLEEGESWENIIKNLERQRIEDIRYG